MSGRRLALGTVGNSAMVAALVVLGVWLAGVQAESVVPPSSWSSRMAWAIGCVAFYAMVSVLLYRRFSHRLRVTPSHTAAGRIDVAVQADARAPVMVVFASQTGFAAELAQRTVDLLASAGWPARLQSLGRLDRADIECDAAMLFVVSTTGEGDAPDDAAGFTREVMSSAPDLSRLRFGVLSLGDSDYARFCGFGRALDAWLKGRGARPLFDAVEIDNGDEAALRHWHHHVSLFAGRTDLPDWQSPRYASWRLDHRSLLNPGSEGDPCFRLALTSPDGTKCDWQAGDIVEIGPCNDESVVREWLSTHSLDGSMPVAVGQDAPETLAQRLARRRLPDASDVTGLPVAAWLDRLPPLPHREYSIASLPGDGRLELVVRQMRQPDGRLGIGSGWLTAYAQPGNRIAARVRRNPAFHPPVDDVPMILIGNGTGIAGLRAHLKARIAAGRPCNWLLFGERHAGRDFFFRDEILAWQSQGWIERVDLAFSRDQAGKIYVQDRLREQGAELARWLDAGAVIYVCGSLAGMAPGVHAVLGDLVGEARLAALSVEGRYRRDVY
jgi:sulfite reductase (NADPH) flavoprotein alpha-component